MPREGRKKKMEDGRMVELINPEKFENTVKFIKGIVDELRRIRVKDMRHAEIYIDEDDDLYVNIEKKNGIKIIIKENYDSEGKYYYIQYGDKEMFIYDDKLVELIDDIVSEEYNRLVKEIEEHNSKIKEEIVNKYF